MLAIETILGALTGYFTNDIAIRQLFAKNGVVVRERAQFTEMIVQVLQDQIIDEETVRALAENPEMAMMFERFLRTLLTEELPYALSDCALADIDSDGALRQLAVAHIQSLDLADARFDSAALAKRLDAVFADDAFVQSAAACAGESGEVLAVGAGRWRACQTLAARPRSDGRGGFFALAFWLGRAAAGCARKSVAGGRRRIAALTGSAHRRCSHPRADAGAVHFGWSTLAARALAGCAEKSGAAGAALCAGERLLQSLLAAHLPTLVAAFAPILQEDRAEIERDAPGERCRIWRKSDVLRGGRRAVGTALRRDNRRRQELAERIFGALR